MSFSHLGLSEKVLAAVASAGYKTPTPIQDQAIPHVLARRDVLGIAQTGTGKTAAFTLPMLTLLEQGRAHARMPRTKRFLSGIWLSVATTRLSIKQKSPESNGISNATNPAMSR